MFDRLAGASRFEKNSEMLALLGIRKSILSLQLIQSDKH